MSPECSPARYRVPHPDPEETVSEGSGSSAESSSLDTAGANCACRPTRFVLVTCSSCEKRAVVPITCGKRTCPTCGRAWARRWARSAEYFVDHARWPMMVTLTRRWREVDLGSYVQATTQAFREIRRRKVWRLARAGLWFVETQRRGESVRVHIHALVDAAWVPQATLARAWGRLVGGDRIVYVQRLARGSGSSAGRYVSKYLTKSCVDPSLTTKVRLVGSWGPAGRRAAASRHEPAECPYCGTAAGWNFVETSRFRPEPTQVKRLWGGIFLLDSP